MTAAPKLDHCLRERQGPFRDTDEDLAVARAELSDLRAKLAAAERDYGEAFRQALRNGARAEAAKRERDEAREWVRRMSDGRTVTCVYCGHAYDPGTQTAQHERLTAHVRECPKHPMRAAEARVERLAEALRKIRIKVCIQRPIWAFESTQIIDAVLAAENEQTQAVRQDGAAAGQTEDKATEPAVPSTHE